MESSMAEQEPVGPENSIQADSRGEAESAHHRVRWLRSALIANLFKSRRRLEAENFFLRHQLNVALRRRPPRLPLRGSDRALFVWMTRLWPNSVLPGWWSRRRSCGGIGRGSGATGAGNHESGQDDRGLIAACSISSDE